MNCSTMVTQLLQYAKDAQSMATQLQQYQTQLQQYTNMVTNTVALPQQVWSTVQSDIMRVQALSNASSLLSGNSGSLITRLQNASSYANQVGSLANIPGQITGYQQTIGNNLSTMGKTLGLQQGQEASNAALLASLQQHSQSAAGQMQAIQAGNELAHQQATQLLQIQATLSGTAQMQATQMAVNADRQGYRGRSHGAFHATVHDRHDRRSAVVSGMLTLKASVAALVLAGTCAGLCRRRLCRVSRHHDGPGGRDVPGTGRRICSRSNKPFPPQGSSAADDRRAEILMRRHALLLGSGLLAASLMIAVPAHAQSANVLDQIVPNSKRDRLAGNARCILALETFGILATIELAWSGFKLAFRGADAKRMAGGDRQSDPFHRVLPRPSCRTPSPGGPRSLAVSGRLARSAGGGGVAPSDVFTAGVSLAPKSCRR